VKPVRHHLPAVVDRVDFEWILKQRDEVYAIVAALMRRPDDDMVNVAALLDRVDAVESQAESDFSHAYLPTWEIRTLLSPKPNVPPEMPSRSVSPGEVEGGDPR
jgi:hypothetical protein